MGHFTRKLTSNGALLQRLPLRVAVVLLVVGLCAPGFADPDDWIDNPQKPRNPRNSQSQAIDSSSSSFAAQPNVSAAQAAARVRRLHGGRVLSVSPSRRGDALGYRVRVLVAGGRVKTVYVDSGNANDAAPSNPAVRTIGDR